MGNVFIDGTRDNGVYARDTFNVEQVEVFKGPAADNGRGAAGGYVNIVTKTPTLEDFVEAEVGFGFDEYDSETRRRVAFDVNQNSGTVSARLNAFVQDGGIAGRDVAEANAWGAAPSLAFGLRTDTRAIFSYEHVERNDVPDSGVAINRPPGQFGVGVDPAGPRGYVANLPRDFFFGRPSDYDDVRADSFIARFEHDLSDSVTITNQTRWSQLDRQVAYHVPSNTLVGGIPGNQNYFDRENETLTNQTNLAARFYTGQFRHTLSTGVEFSREEGDALRFATGNADLRPRGAASRSIRRPPTSTTRWSSIVTGRSSVASASRTTTSTSPARACRACLQDGPTATRRRPSAARLASSTSPSAMRASTPPTASRTCRRDPCCRTLTSRAPTTPSQGSSPAPTRSSSTTTKRA